MAACDKNNCCFCTQGCSACPFMKPALLRTVALGAVGASVGLALHTKIGGDAPLAFSVCGRPSMMVPPSCSKYAFPTMAVSCMIGLEIVFARLKKVCCSGEEVSHAEQRRKCLNGSAVSMVAGAVTVAVAQYFSYAIAAKDKDKMPCCIAITLLVSCVLPSVMLTTGCCKCFKGCCKKQ